jgi:hypothetical protein
MLTPHARQDEPPLPRIHSFAIGVMWSGDATGQFSLSSALSDFESATQRRA